MKKDITGLFCWVDDFYISINKEKRKIQNKNNSRKRSLVKTVFDYLKNKLMLEHSRHRSFVNMLVHIVSTLIVYQIKPTKPSISSHFYLPSNP